ncbi:MAG TPA: hypothetical protein VEF36_15225 [Roseiarcus sp.]|nr:hypothetical protein [Roseiarcus sp.]
MKRPPPAFIVEVRRQRRSTNTGGKGWFTESALSGAGAGSQRHLGATALFEPERKAPAALEAPQPRPQGRILPSLADIEPIASRFEEAAAPPRRKRESLGPAAKPKARTKKEPSREFAPSLRSFEEPSVEFRAAAPRAPGKAADAGPKARPSPPAAKPKREVATAQALASALAARAIAAAKPAAVPADAANEDATALRSEARQARHRRIMDRYVLGGEAKPGRRWKRRTQEAQK